MTLGDLLRQDGAFALLLMGAVLGFLANMAFRAIVKRKGSVAPEPAAAAPEAPVFTPASPPQNTTALIAAITAAVNMYRKA